nr:MAG TPA_asm: hypothetical protein [Caudoviricetes sp.]
MQIAFAIAIFSPPFCFCCPLLCDYIVTST